MSICLVSSKVLWEHLEMKDSETNPLMRSLPQVVFTAACLSQDLTVDNTVVLTIVSLKYTVPVAYSA